MAWGKCLGRGTLVLMFDGTIKPVEDIAAGDLLMGPDNTPR
jgi:replicative DNA helicase